MAYLLYIGEPGRPLLVYFVTFQHATRKLPSHYVKSSLYFPRYFCLRRYFSTRNPPSCQRPCGWHKEGSTVAACRCKGIDSGPAPTRPTMLPCVLGAEVLLGRSERAAWSVRTGFTGTAELQSDEYD
jgi:hypothetical protein